MSFSFNVNTSAEAVKDSGGRGIISESGYYLVKVVNAWVTTNDKGARSVNLKINCDGVEQYLFNAFRLDKNDGKPAFGHDMFNKFTIVCGFSSLESEEKSIKIGQESKTVTSLSDFEDVEVMLKLVASYSYYNDKVYKEMAIREVFRASDNATAQEIVNKDEHPDKLGSKFNESKDTQPKDILGKGVTEEMVAAYEQERKSGGKTKTANAAPSEQSSLFG